MPKPPCEEWLKPGHLCVSAYCRFGRCTAVNGYIISSVGDYYSNGVRETVGYDRFFETMVFKDSGKRCDVPECTCGRLPEPVDWSEIDFAPANTREECEANHERLVAEYAAKEASRD